MRQSYPWLANALDADVLLATESDRPMLSPTRSTREALELLQWPGIGPGTVRQLYRSRIGNTSLIEQAQTLSSATSDARAEAAAGRVAGTDIRTP